MPRPFTACAPALRNAWPRAATSVLLLATALACSSGENAGGAAGSVGTAGGGLPGSGAAAGLSSTGATGGSAASNGGTSGTGPLGSGGGGAGPSAAGSGGSIAAAGTSAGTGAVAGGGAVGAGGAGAGGVPSAGGAGAGGAPSAGGSSAGASPMAGAAGAVTMGACTFTVTPELSTEIASVGIVQWSVDLANVDSASIEFGLDTNYGMSAPVDLAEPSYRTLLLGMKYSHTYHFKVAAQAGATRCESPDYTIETGAPPNVLTKPTITTNDAAALIGGYLITARWGSNNGGPSFILDADNDFVWSYPGEDDVIRTRMSFDGKYMWIRNTAQVDGAGVVKRVTLDGLHEDRWELPNTTHDLAVIPDGHVGLVGHASNGCDEILDFNPEDQSLTSLFNATEAHGQTNCHVNYLAYYAGDDSFVFSDYEASSLIKITRHGDLVWVLNGNASDFTGTNWSQEHGVHILGVDHLLVFSNGTAGQNSIVYEWKLDLAAMTASELWHYDGGESATFGGDVQRLDNGNTLITYSSAGVIQEVNAQGQLLQELLWPISFSVSYTQKRPTLYGGPPPKIY